MKRLIAVAAALFAVAISVYAVPAKPGKFKYTQPDGTVVMLERHGDEFFHWVSDESGQVVVRDSRGFIVPGRLDYGARERGIARKAALARERRSLSTRVENDRASGEKHIPVILVEFKDVSFKISDPAAKFDALLNQEGYSDNGATGSVRDYYFENSHGKYQPVFDVFGPVTLSNDVAYYGGGDEDNAPLAVIEGATLLDDRIDFSKYDYDSDGTVDMILMYYAGYNEAESDWDDDGVSDAEETIWPHQFYAYYSQKKYLDGKLLGRYFCTSELKGSKSEGVNMCGIGTTCHEFAHSLGLPDFYDTDETEEDKEKGSAHGLAYFSLMHYGPYLNNGRTPPYLNAEERIMLGWMEESELKELPTGDDIRLSSIKDNVAYRSESSTEGEYFVYECRDFTGWDSFISYGLYVYHVDKSTDRKVGKYTPYELWYNWERTNAINADRNHPCFYIVPSHAQTSLSFWPEDTMARYPFPGKNNITGYSPVDWNGRNDGTSLSGIKYDGSIVHMNAYNPSSVIPEESLTALGYAYIDLGGGKFSAGESLELKVAFPEYSAPSSVNWFFDGKMVSGASVSLVKGVHKVKARLTYSDGRKETISAEIKVD